MSLPSEVSRETRERLQEFAALLKTWNERINLIARGDVAAIWDRHIEDSLQVLDCSPTSPTHWLDIGTGGGFPGLVVAIANIDLAPATRHTLIESDKRKAAFLMTAANHLDAKVTVLPVRSESAPPQAADVISSRAFAPLIDLCTHLERHLSPGGTALLLKGETAPEEIAAARKRWTFDCIQHKSRTNHRATILQISGLKRD